MSILWDSSLFKTQSCIKKVILYYTGFGSSSKKKKKEKEKKSYEASLTELICKNYLK